MKNILLISLFAIIMLGGCAGKNDINSMAIPEDKIYNVIFEGDPKITDQRVMSSGLQIGDILLETPSGSGLTVTKISVQEEHTPLIRSNTVFVVKDGYLNYDTVGNTGEPLFEGGRLLGFTGKAKLLWFKTKAKVSGMSQAAKSKAAELYNKVRTK